MAIDIRQLIVATAQQQGVDPGVALAVATRESGQTQWHSNGSVVTGADSEIGMFQLMPSTAAGLGVDPYDLQGNISGGVAYLAQMYQKFGSWERAAQAYNWGPERLEAALAAGRSVPSSVVAYAKFVIATAAISNGALAVAAAKATPAAVSQSGNYVQSVNSTAPPKNVQNAVFTVVGLGALAAVALALGD